MKKILIVDDSEMARASMSFSLRSKKYDVIEASNGREAIEKLNENADIGLIITDLNMPEIDGFELIKYVREKSSHKNLPVYVITTEESTGQDAVKKGATGIIKKSSKTAEEMHKIVNKYIA